MISWLSFPTSFYMTWCTLFKCRSDAMTLTTRHQNIVVQLFQRRSSLATAIKYWFGFVPITRSLTADLVCSISLLQMVNHIRFYTCKQNYKIPKCTLLPSLCTPKSHFASQDLLYLFILWLKYSTIRWQNIVSNCVKSHIFEPHRLTE